jgi:hypothetical protein
MNILTSQQREDSQKEKKGDVRNWLDNEYKEDKYLQVSANECRVGAQ